MAARASRRPPLATLARRWLAVVLVAVIGYAYYHPIKSWIETRHELSTRRAEVGRLANEKRALRDRLQFSASSDALRAGRAGWGSSARASTLHRQGHSGLRKAHYDRR
jgi:hypothetical protein